MENEYKELLVKIITILKEERKNEGSSDLMTPSEIINKIIGLSTNLPDIRDLALKESYGED